MLFRSKDTYIVTFGRDFAVANTESTRPGSEGISRQSQTWVRMPEGWRIVSAHVSDQGPITVCFARCTV